jgi:hypothetical protein
LNFHSHNENFGTHCKNVINSIYLLFFILVTLNSVSVEYMLIWSYGAMAVGRGKTQVRHRSPQTSLALPCVRIRTLAIGRRRPTTFIYSQYWQIFVLLLRNIENAEHQSQGAWRLCDCGQSTIPSVHTCIWTVVERVIITLLEREHAFMMFVQKAVMIKFYLLASHFLCPWSCVCSSLKLGLCIGCLL